MRKVMKEIFWWTVSLFGAALLMVCVAKPTESVTGTIICLFGALCGFIICAAAAQETQLGKNIVSRHHNGNQ